MLRERCGCTNPCWVRTRSHTRNQKFSDRCGTQCPCGKLTHWRVLCIANNCSAGHSFQVNMLHASSRPP